MYFSPDVHRFDAIFVFPAIFFFFIFFVLFFVLLFLSSVFAYRSISIVWSLVYERFLTALEMVLQNQWPIGIFKQFASNANNRGK